MLMPKEMPSKPIVASQAMNLRKVLSAGGNPMLFHLISSGSRSLFYFNVLDRKITILEKFPKLKY